MSANQDMGASVPDRAGAPSGLSPRAVSSEAAHPSRERMRMAIAQKLAEMRDVASCKCDVAYIVQRLDRIEAAIRDLTTSGSIAVADDIERSSVRATASGLLSRKDAAIYLGYEYKTLSEWQRLGKGPRPRKIGGRVFYALADLQKFVSGQ